MIDEATLEAAAALLDRCRTAGIRLATAESCTGGLIVAALTAIPGSSDVVDRGYITYSNEAKTEALGVPAALIAAAGAVSEPVAERMAEGALAGSRAELTVAVTGIAGPGGGSPEKPVGLVWFAVGRRGLPPVTRRQVFAGDRAAVRAGTVVVALVMLQEAAASLAPGPVPRANGA